MTADALAVLDHLGWTDPVRVAGHSLGGWIAETLVLDHPQRVRSAALMGSANKPTAWEIAITTVERDLARLDVDLPPLFYATQTLRYLPDRGHSKRRRRQHVAVLHGRPPGLAESGPSRAVRGGAGLVDRSPAHHPMAARSRFRASSSPSSTTWTLRRRRPVRPPRVIPALRVPRDRRFGPHRHRHACRRSGGSSRQLLCAALSDRHGATWSGSDDDALTWHRCRSTRQRPLRARRAVRRSGTRRRRSPRPGRGVRPRCHGSAPSLGHSPRSAGAPHVGRRTGWPRWVRRRSRSLSR